MTPTHLYVEGEHFSVSIRFEATTRLYDFAWVNGPSGDYGFTIGGASEDLSESELNRWASGFVRTFFAPGGIGEADFPDFVTSRGLLTSDRSSPGERTE